MFLQKMRHISVVLLLFLCIKSKAQVAASISMWKDSVIGAVWNQATHTVAYGKPGANGYYKIYLSDSLGNNVTPLTYPAWPPDRHQWAEEWDPTGQYLFCYVEKTAYAWETNHIRIPGDAIPGYGAYTDIWMIKRDGSQAWQLTNFPNDYDHGVIHGGISNDGTKFTWTERIQRPNIFDLNLMAGAYVFKVADVTYSPTPALTNIQTFQPGGVLAGGEVESFSADKSTIAFYSTFETQSIINTPIYTLNTNTGQIKKLTSQSFAQAPTYTPDGNHIVYMTGQNCDFFPGGQLQGADWWIMEPDSSNRKRLTYMNVTGHPQCVNQYRLAGSLSFMSNTTFLGGIMTKSAGLEGYTAKVSFGNLVSVNEYDEIKGFTLYPNPANNELHIRADHIAGNFTVKIFDILGQEVLAKTNETLLDLSLLPQGTYVVELSSAKASARKKIIKE